MIINIFFDVIGHWEKGKRKIVVILVSCPTTPVFGLPTSDFFLTHFRYLFQ